MYSINSVPALLILTSSAAALMAGWSQVSHWGNGGEERRSTRTERHYALEIQPLGQFPLSLDEWIGQSQVNHAVAANSCS